MDQERRRFLEFLGHGALTAATAAAIGPSLTASLARAASGRPNLWAGDELPFSPVAPSSADALLLADGFRHDILIRWDDVINARGERFGFNNDYTRFVPDGPSDAWLWVNHEYPVPLLQSGTVESRQARRKLEDVRREQESLGGSILRMKRAPKGAWRPVVPHGSNRRVSGLTPIPFAGASRPIAGAMRAIGTVGNCSGGLTPWGTILTCEENHQDIYGERDWKTGKPDHSECWYGWESVVDYPPEHYGWVVEVELKTGKAKKLVALGRFGHESATVRQARDGRCVVYSGDDRNDRCLYKFVASKKGTLEHGTLHVANLEQGRWIPLDRASNPTLRKKYKDQLEVLIRAREAAYEVGGTRLDRPEDIEIDPTTGAVLVTLTNNKPRKNFFGSILKIEEKGGDPLALEFKHSTFASGGPETGFACPDNLAFDPRGGLWVTSDISGKTIGRDEYAPFKNNGLFYVPMKGKNAGRFFRVASAPVEAEFTGPCFTPDGKTLFLSVQHPGEESKALDRLTSHWPDGGSTLPRPAVIAITGPALEKLAAT